MIQQFNKNDFCNFSGQIQFLIYNQKQQLINKNLYHNSLTSSGISSYHGILSNIFDMQNPISQSYDDDYELNILSNPSDFFVTSGENQFLQVVDLCDESSMTKAQSSFEYGFQYKHVFNESTGYKAGSVDYQGSFSTDIVKNSMIVNSTQNSMFLNSDNKDTIIQTTISHYKTFKSLGKWAYVYRIADVKDDLFFSGLSIDLQGPQYNSFYMQIAFDFQGIEINSLEDVPKPIMPFLNGKPVNRQFLGFQGAALLNNAAHTYFFDMYPRFAKIPKQIIFLFEQNNYRKDISEHANLGEYFNLVYDTTSIIIKKIQFFKHKQKKVGPTYIKLYNKNNQDYKYFAKINKVKIIGNDVCYFSTIGYNEANDMIFNAASLVNFKENYQYVKDQLVNFQYLNNSNNGINQTLFNALPTNNGNDCFYQIRRKQYSQQKEQQVNNLTYFQFEDETKTKQRRIDIVYKIKLGFGDENE